MGNQEQSHTRSAAMALWIDDEMTKLVKLHVWRVDNLESARTVLGHEWKQRVEQKSRKTAKKLSSLISIV